MLKVGIFFYIDDKIHFYLNWKTSSINCLDLNLSHVTVLNINLQIQYRFDKQYRLSEVKFYFYTLWRHFQRNYKSNDKMASYLCNSITRMQINKKNTTFLFLQKRNKIFKIISKKKSFLLILIPKLKESNKNALILTYGKYT